MTEQPQEPISEITETSDIIRSKGNSHFAAAMGWGTLVGTGILVTTILAPLLVPLEGIDGFRIGLWALVFAVFVVGLFTLSGMLLIGLPVTFLLRAIDCEYRALYAVLGAVAGFTVLAVMMEFPRYGRWEEIILPTSGALAGLASAYRWGRWRQDVAEAKREARRNAQARRRDNPIHDLIH